MPSAGTFKATHPFPVRCSKSAAYRSLSSNHGIPVIVERAPVSFAAKSKHKHKHDLPRSSEYVVPRTATMGEFIFRVRRELGWDRKRKGKEGKALYMMVGRREVIVEAGKTMEAVAREWGEEDGWVYAVWAEENTFG